MQPNSEPDVHQPCPADATPWAVSPELEELLRRIAGCSRADKRIILDRLLRHLLGDHPEQESAVYNPDGTPYIFLLPRQVRLKLEHTPQFLAELDRRSKSPGKTRPLSEVIEQLEAME